MDEQMFVNFACQRCLQPIKIDESLINMNEHVLAELALPIFSKNGQELDSNESYDHFIPPYPFFDSLYGGGFTMVSNRKESYNFYSALKLKAELFDYLSSNSEIDHPLCDECSDSLLEMLDHELQIAESDWNDYNNYLKDLDNSGESIDIEELEKELNELVKNEEELLSDLKRLKDNIISINETIHVQEEESRRIQQEESRYWREYTKHRRDLLMTEDEYRSLDTQIHNTKLKLNQLKKSNVFNITFHIWHAGHFGTINNFRLGRLPSEPVEWSEINAAWGQTALLLSALARKVNLKFKRYRLIPFGNRSHVEVLADGKELPLYGSGGFKFFWDTKFDSAMVAFLDCLAQFKEEIEKGDTGFCLPYKMEKGRIEDSSTGNSFSIKIQFNSEEQWTKALKFALTNLKWGLAWVSSQFTDGKVNLPDVK